MKKTILAVLIVVMIATPCFAQEVETDGLFSIEGTLWSLAKTESYYGFSDGTVYFCGNVCLALTASSYIDFPFFCLFSYHDKNSIGYIFPIIGMGIVFYRSGDKDILIKTENNWTPPEVISYIVPREGEQGTTLTDILITCLNTTFQDDPPVEISFDPPDGLTVSNINVTSNTEIEFDLEIAVDAPIGERQVIVTYDDGNKFLEEDNAFEVLP
jgi:hypothetical protein